MSGKTTVANSIPFTREQLEREDLVMFINTCFAATNQHEYYNDGLTESISVQFLHEYVLYNYRRLYSLCLGLQINHFNKQTIIINLLASGVPATEFRREEGKLIAEALQQLPANRAFSVLDSLAKRKINNRRCRAIVKEYLSSRKDSAFDTVKYRRQYRSIARHAHLDVGEETSDLLFGLKKQSSYSIPLFETYRQAHYSKTAVYQLPYSIAEGFAQRHNIPRDEFLRRIAPMMTPHEKLRMQNAATRQAARLTGKHGELAIDLGTTSLTRLALYVLSLPLKERTARALELHESLQRAAIRVQKRHPITSNRVAAVLDASRSARGSRQKLNRPFAIALGVHYLLQAGCGAYQAFWTPSDDRPDHYPFLREAEGATALADPVIDALQWQPDLLVIVSDGYENDPPDSVNRIVIAAQKYITGTRETEIVHANPVFDPEHFSPRPLGNAIPTVGLRDVEDLPTMLEFSGFVSGQLTLAQLENYLLTTTAQGNLPQSLSK
ncbi:hypothetical protein AB833_03480 [Chromatiales bacterium (ex Bugula neritina AB1)]|nr:hypothetical protein AB833_03480 [Chromatiales bacterium (ex Bugula neritina AB1)]